MLKALWRTHSCVPRSHSCERWPSRLAYHWRSMLLVTIEHECFKMFAHEKTSGIARFACRVHTRGLADSVSKRVRALPTAYDPLRDRMSSKWEQFHNARFWGLFSLDSRC
jgi:hypothetical protein